MPSQQPTPTFDGYSLRAEVSHQEKPESASTNFEVLGKDKIAWKEGAVLEALRSASGIDSQAEAHGRNPISWKHLDETYFRGSAWKHIELMGS